VLYSKVCRQSGSRSNSREDFEPGVAHGTGLWSKPWNRTVDAGDAGVQPGLELAGVEVPPLPLAVV
jgi:hypothetical protein